jgi:prolyl oligopeptidase
MVAIARTLRASYRLAPGQGESMSAKLSFAAVTFVLLVTSAPAHAAQANTLAYPPARKADVVDEYFGTRVSDPYRWMEQLDSPELKDWLAAQTALTSGYLERLALREPFRRRITELWNYSKTTLPDVESGKLFYRSNSGLERQSPVYIRADLDAPRKLLIDPNALSPDGSVSLAEIAPSPDARLIAYTLSEGGADWQTIRLREVATGRELTDEVRWVRFSWLSWTQDGKGFFYSRYPEPPAGKALQSELGNHVLYYHRVGTPQSRDLLVYERKDLPGWLINAWVPEDGRYLIVRVTRAAGMKARLYFADLGDPMRPNLSAAVKPLAEDDGTENRSLGVVGSTLYVRTDRGAPNRKIVSTDLASARPGEWKTVIPERKDAIHLTSLVGGRLVLAYMHDVQSRLVVFDTSGRELQQIALPAPGVVTDMGGRVDSPHVYYTFTSPLYPLTVYAYDLSTRKSATLDPPQRVVDTARYESVQHFATSKDGTRVPYTLTSRRELPRDGSTPTLLMGYGGFASNLLPIYRPHAIAWLERGGAFVTANIRGGGEYGDAWFQAARAEKRQNGFDDFIAVAEDLVARKVTAPAKLGIIGGSNGGLLVAAVSQQRPDLFGVVLSQVPVTDMLRFDRFTGGRLWIGEYGSPADRTQFEHLLRISPVHNVKSGACYPATLVTTADHDDRVVPSHSFKYTAALQLAQGCGHPALLRVEPKASHGYRPTDRLIAEIADIWAFAAEQLGLGGMAAAGRD